MTKLNKLLIIVFSLSLLTGCGNQGGGDTPTPPTPTPPTPVIPTSVSLSFTEKTLEIGESVTLTATVLPSDATDKSVNYSVDKSNIVSVDQNGLITALSAGYANVTVSCNVLSTVKATATITVNEAPTPIISVTGVTLNKSSIDLINGGTFQLEETVLPSNATDKSVTYSSNDTKVCTVDNTGKVTATGIGKTSVIVKTNDQNKTASCNVDVTESSIKGYLFDTKSLVTKVEESSDGETYKEVDAVKDGETIYYMLTYGYFVRVSMQEKGYIVPTGVQVDDNLINVDSDKRVTFKATVEDPYDPDYFFLSMTVKYKDNTPVVGEYTFDFIESEHLTLEALNSDKEHIVSCNQSDEIYIKVTASEPNFVVKSMVVSRTTSDIGSVDKTTLTANSDGLFFYRVGYCYNKVLKVTVTEKDGTKFVGSDLVGTYLITRSYGFSESENPSQMSITAFTNNNLTFDESGEISIPGLSEKAYAEEAKDGVITATYSYGTYKLYYDKNIIVYGTNSSGGSLADPMSSSLDVGIATKIQDDTEIKDYSIKAEAFRTNSVSYCVYQVYLNDKVLTSVFFNITTKQVFLNVDITMFHGESIIDAEAVYSIKNNQQKLLEVGYKDEGTYKNREVLTSISNLYTNDEHTLVFISNTKALFDENAMTFTIEELTGKYILETPSKKVTLTLDDSTMKFVVDKIEDKTVKEIDIKNKVFNGKYMDDSESVNTTITFGDSNTDITGKIVGNAYFKWYWTFTGVLDKETNIITITITDFGYNTTSLPSYGSIGLVSRMFLAEGQLTIKDRIVPSGVEHAYNFQNQVFTCSDFHI